MGNQTCIQGRLGLLIVTVHTILMLAVATSVFQMDSKDNRRSNTIGTIPCSQRFHIASYFEKHDRLVDSHFENFLDHNFLLTDSNSFLEPAMSNMLELSVFHRHLRGEGSHRHLVTSVRFDINSKNSLFDTEFCEAVVIERLPAGVFADPFELQHLVQRGVLLDAAVFGDTNLELPSALSRHSVVEIHKDIVQNVSSNRLNGLEFTIDLPLHARYPPLDSKGYSRVVMGKPDLIIRCNQKIYEAEECFSLFNRWSVGHIHDIEWQIPCGSEELARIVTIVTFASALVSSLLIVIFAVYPSLWKEDIKNA